MTPIECATTSCSSCAMRSRSSATARFASSSRSRSARRPRLELTAGRGDGSNGRAERGHAATKKAPRRELMGSASGSPDDHERPRAPPRHAAEPEPAACTRRSGTPTVYEPTSSSCDCALPDSRSIDGITSTAIDDDEHREWRSGAGQKIRQAARQGEDQAERVGVGSIDLEPPDRRRGRRDRDHGEDGAEARRRSPTGSAREAARARVTRAVNAFHPVTYRRAPTGHRPRRMTPRVHLGVRTRPDRCCGSPERRSRRSAVRPMASPARRAHRGPTDPETRAHRKGARHAPSP